MNYCRVSKTSSYFSRFNVKYRRRRTGKTDYRARHGLVNQDKNQYIIPKFRLIVRFSNKNIFCQIVYTTVVGDKVCCHSYAHELPNYGLPVGLTNYSAAYAVGLLCARRCLCSLALQEKCTKTDPVTGISLMVEPVEAGIRPFKVIIDTGIKRTSTGSKIFGVLKGAFDGGLNIPHNEKRFVGYGKITKKYDPELLRKYILGGHVSDFMQELEEEEPDSFRRQFSQYIAHQVKYTDLAQLYEMGHKAIRENPVKHRKPRGSRHSLKCTYTEKMKFFKNKLASLGVQKQ